MKLNKIKIFSFFGPSGYSSCWLSYTTLFFFAILIEMYCLIVGASMITGDSFLFGTVITVQYVVFFLSIIYFSKIARRFIPSLKCAFWTTAVYGLLPSFASFNNFILTESFTVSFVIFFIWTLFNALHKGNKHVVSAVISGIWLIVMIFLRPVMICLIPVYVIFWAYIALRRKNSLPGVVMGICMLLLCFAGLTFYKHNIYLTYGQHTMSAASITNNYYSLRELDYIGPEHTDNTLYKHFLDSVRGTSPRLDNHANWGEQFYIRDTIHVTWNEQEAAVEQGMSQYRFMYARIAKRNLKYLYDFQLLPDMGIFPFYFQSELFPISLSCYVLFMAIAFILLIWRIHAIKPWLLFLTSAAITGAALIGAMDDWTRLFLPGMPPALLLFSYLFLPAFQARKELKSSQ